MEKEFTNEFGRTFSKVIYLHNYQAVVIEWHGYTTKLHIETVANWVEQWSKLNPCTTIINDCSKIISVWEDSIDWFSRIWIQKMKNIGLKKYIHISKEGSFGAKIGEKLFQTIKERMQFYSFGNRADAIHFLETDKTSLNN